ncbi:MAG: hypothetical protein HYV41_05535 [Candidatus Magasanikbacteria bacterium]|nr:hypothetical protein [Candidatus Magasanikbacteria bacterium]
MSRFVLAQIARVTQILSAMLPKKLSRYHYRVFFVFLLVVGLVFGTQFVFAQDIAGDLLKGISWLMLAIAKICIVLTIFFLRFFITLASYNNYIDVSVVKLGWVMIRDVANMFFVVALLIIAFATILGLEQYEWKKGLVKLIIMAIFINFSNLIAQLIIDVAHVFTITFLNAISATAGGNLINMFKLEKIMSMATGASYGTSAEQVTIEVLGASVVATFFAVMSAVAVGSYVIVMAIRVVVLWALIILSPLAYVLYAIPKGEKYAQEWWSEFTKYVIVAPVMVFFLWLAFATLGSGDIANQIQSTAGVVPLQEGNEQLKISLSEVSTWENMSNFLIAMVFLMVGLKQTQATGVEGSGIVSGAVNFGKKVATIATGYATGRWLVGKGTDTAKKGLSAGAYYFPKVGGKSWEQRGKTIATDVKGWWHLKAAGLTKDRLQDQVELGKKKQQLSPEALNLAHEIATLEGQRGLAQKEGNMGKVAELDKQLKEKNEEKNSFGEGQVTIKINTLKAEIEDLETKRDADGTTKVEKMAIEKELKQKQKDFEDINDNPEKQKEIADKEQKALIDVIEHEKRVTAAQGKGLGVVGWVASGGIKRQRRMGKSEKTAKLAEEVAYKRTGSDSNFHGLKWMGMKDMDRSLKGILESEEERSDAKTSEMSSAAKYSTSTLARYKDGKWEHGKERVADQVAKHKIKAEITQESLKGVELKARVQLISKDGAGSLLSQLAAAKGIAANFQDTVQGKEETSVSKFRESRDQAVFEKIEQAKKAALGGEQVDEQIQEAKSSIEKTQAEIGAVIGLPKDIENIIKSLKNPEDQAFAKSRAQVAMGKIVAENEQREESEKMKPEDMAKMFAERLADQLKQNEEKMKDKDSVKTAIGSLTDSAKKPEEAFVKNMSILIKERPIGLPENIEKIITDLNVMNPEAGATIKLQTQQIMRNLVEENDKKETSEKMTEGDMAKELATRLQTAFNNFDPGMIPDKSALRGVSASLDKQIFNPSRDFTQGLEEYQRSYSANKEGNDNMPNKLGELSTQQKNLEALEARKKGISGQLSEARATVEGTKQAIEEKEKEKATLPESIKSLIRNLENFKDQEFVRSHAGMIMGQIAEENDKQESDKKMTSEQMAKLFVEQLKGYLDENKEDFKDPETGFKLLADLEVVAQNPDADFVTKTKQGFTNRATVQSEIQALEKNLNTQRGLVGKLLADESKAVLASIEKLEKAGEIPEWQSARAQAEREHSALFYRRGRSSLMSQASQRHIYDKHGITSPDTSDVELTETLVAKEFKNMNYETTVDNLRRNRAIIGAKMDRGEKLSPEESAMVQALFMRMHNEAWVDDGITDHKKRSGKAEAVKFYAQVKAHKDGKKLDFNVEGDEQKKYIESAMNDLQRHQKSGAGGSLGQAQKDSLAKFMQGILGDQASTLISALKSDANSGIALQQITDILGKKQSQFQNFSAELQSAIGTTDIDRVQVEVLKKLRQSMGDQRTLDELINKIR